MSPFEFMEAEEIDEFLKKNIGCKISPEPITQPKPSRFN
jgi:hypothetical protein